MKYKIVIRILILIFAVSFMSANANSDTLLAKNTISGVVKDSISREGLPFATIQVPPLALV